MNKKIPIIILGAVIIILAVAVYYQKYRRQPASQVPADKAPAMTLEEAKAIASAAVSECQNQGGLTGKDDLYNESTKTWWLGWAPALPKEGCSPACVVSEETKTAEINWRCTGLTEASSTEPEIEVNRVTSQYGFLRTFENQGGAQYVNIDPIDYFSKADGTCRGVDGTDRCGAKGVGLENTVYELLALPLAADVYIQNLAGQEEPLSALIEADPQERKEVPYKLESEKGVVVRIYEVAKP